MMGLATTMPAVIKSLQRMDGETLEAKKLRIGPFASVISDESGDAVFSPMRILASSAHNYFNKEIQIEGKTVNLSDWAKKEGYFAQSVNDMLEPFSKPHSSQFAAKLDKLVSLVSKPSDMSETFSRGLAFHAGWQVGEGLGIKEARNLASFSHDFANKVIGDYRPTNRPQMFQGAVGMPLGLFTTFMWNYNERLFRYIEGKQARAFYTQIATQASLFGANSVPGYSQYTNWFASNYDGTASPAVGIESRFGTTLADWWHYGTFSNLPKLFGASDGIAFSQRGDAGLKMVPTLFNPANTPVATSIKKLYTAVSGITTAIRNNGVEPKQIAQLLAQNSISRPFRSLVEWYSDESLDKNGRVINDDVRSTMGTISRILDMKTLSEAKNAEAFYQIGAGRMARNERMTELSDTMEFNARNDKYIGEAGAKQLSSDFRTYFENGGDPGGFAALLRNKMLMSHMDRTTAQSMKQLSGTVTNKDLQDVKRLMWSQMPVTNSDLENPSMK